jgi:hypothetical protein
VGVDDIRAPFLAQPGDCFGELSDLAPFAETRQAARLAPGAVEYKPLDLFACRSPVIPRTSMFAVC